MADTLAPQLPATGEPSYMNWFHPSRPFAGSKAGEIRGAAIGKAIGEGTQALETGYKGAADWYLHSQTDPIQEAMTKQLEGALSQTQDNPKKTQQDPTSGLYDYDRDQPMPETLNQDMRKAQSLQTAAEYGKVSPTYYLGQLNEVAKRARSMFPGMRNEVDNFFHKMTGHPIGNAYMMSMIHDLNAQGSNKDAMKNDLIKELAKQANEGDEISRQYMIKLRDGVWNYDYTQKKLTEHNAPIWAQKQLELKLKDVKGNDELAERDTIRAVSGHYALQSSQIMDMPAIQMDFGDGKVALSIHQLQAGIDSGAIKMDPEKLGQAAQQVSLFLQKTREEWTNYAKDMRYKGADGLTPWERDQDGVKKVMDANLAQLKDYLEDLTDPNHHGLAFYTANKQKNRINSDIWKLEEGEYDTPDHKFSVDAKIHGMLKQLWGEAAYSQYMLQHTAEMDKAVSGLKTHMNDRGMATNNEGPDRPEWTLGDTFSVQQRIKNIEGKPMAMDYRTYKSTVDMFPKLPRNIQESSAVYFFGHKGNTLDAMDQLKRDERDPDTNELKPGKFRLFMDLTDMSMTKSIAKLSSEFGQMQRAWAENNFSKLFLGEAQTLSKHPEIPGVTVSYDPKLHHAEVHVDNEKFEAAIQTEKQRGPVSSQEGRYRSALHELQQSADNLNIGFKGLSNIATVYKGDVNNYIKKVFAEKGLDPEKLGYSSATTMLGGILTSILGSVGEIGRKNKTPIAEPK